MLYLRISGTHVFLSLGPWTRASLYLKLIVAVSGAGAVRVQKKNVNTFLTDLMKHMTAERAFESHYSQVRKHLNTVVYL